MLRALCCDLRDMRRCALSSTSILSILLHLTLCDWSLFGSRRRRCPIRFARNRGEFELSWSFELTMLASLSADWLWLARCAVGGGCGAKGWRS